MCHHQLRLYWIRSTVPIHATQLHAASSCSKLVVYFSFYTYSPRTYRYAGIAKRQATWMLGGEEKGRQTAAALLTSLGNIVDMGNDVGAANVVKLCGNFLIAVG
jgi:hypothetical protein